MPILPTQYSNGSRGLGSNHEIRLIPNPTAAKIRPVSTPFLCNKVWSVIFPLTINLNYITKPVSEDEIIRSSNFVVPLYALCPHPVHRGVHTCVHTGQCLVKPLNTLFTWISVMKCPAFIWGGLSCRFSKIPANIFPQIRRYKNSIQENPKFDGSYEIQWSDMIKVDFSTTNSPEKSRSCLKKYINYTL